MKENIEMKPTYAEKKSKVSVMSAKPQWASTVDQHLIL